MATGRIRPNAVCSTTAMETGRPLNEPIFGNAEKIFFTTPSTKNVGIRKSLTVVAAFNRVRFFDQL
jgi:hypothetical protein